MEPETPLLVVKKKLIILANSETLCAYRMLSGGIFSPQGRIEKIPIILPPLQPDPTETTDNDGRFPGGSTVNNRTSMRHGEPHGRKTERRKRQLRNMAHTICDLFNHEDFDVWNLAIPEGLSHQLIEQLPIQVQHKLTHCVNGDYNRQPTHKIEHLFSS